MDVAASTITIVSSACTLALHLKRLIQSLRQKDENAKDLEDKIDTLTTILGQASSVYGPDGSRSYSSSEQQIRQAIRNVVVGCKNDLTRFGAELKKLLSHGNWVSVAWRQQVVAPKLVSIERSVSERQQRLSMLVQLLQGVQLHQMHEIQTQVHRMLQMLTNKSTTDTIPKPSGGGNIADIESTILRVTTALIGEEGLEIQEDKERKASEIIIGEAQLETLQGSESNANGPLLLEAIQDGDADTFKSLLHDCETSFRERDSEGRNPLLLAAHLGNAGMVKKLLAVHDDAKNKSRAPTPWDCSTDVASSSSPEDDKREEDTKTIDHREIDLDATDKLGRTALHYCAEFDMYDEAKFLLDSGVDVNARDNGDFPPAYFAAKNRRYNATKLLLEKGASTDFQRPTLTSLEIEKLLEKSPNNDRSMLVSRSGSSRRRSVTTPRCKKGSLSILRRWSVADGS